MILPNKKAQVTIFIIIGLILLVITGIVLYINSNNGFNNEPNTHNTIIETETKYQPVVNYVDQCLNSIGTKIIKQMGSQGGYLKPEQLFETDIAKPYDAEGVRLTQSEKTTIPYWIYSKEESEQNEYVTPTIEIPELKNIQQNYEEEIDKQLLSCINNFQDLEFSGASFEIEQNPKTKVVFTNEDINILTTLPIKITKPDGTIKKISQFEKTIDIPFKKYYLMAKIISLQELKYSYLEKVLTAIISYYGNAGDTESIPPFYTIQDGYSFITWLQPDVKSKIQTLLQENIQLMRVTGTKNEIKLDEIEGLSEQEKNYFKMLNMPILPVAFPNVSINYEYLNWPIYLQVYPHEGALIKPIAKDYPLDKWYKARDQTYRFYYDISYPVVVEIREDNLSQGNKFSFVFAMEGNIRKNYDWRAYVEGKGPIVWDPRTDVSATIKGQSDEIQDLITNKTYNVPSIVTKLFNNKNQFVSQPLKIETINQITGEPIEGAKIQIGIGTYARTIIGKTETKNGKALFEGKGPIVRNGYLTISKDGYLPYSKFVNLSSGNNTLDLGRIKLLPSTEKNISVKIWDVNEIIIPDRPELLEEVDNINTSEELNNFLKDLMYEEDDQPIKLTVLTERNKTENETIMITFDYVPLGLSTTKLTAYANFQNDTEIQTINIVPGRYEIKGQLFDSAGVIIPKHSQKICHSRKECKRIPEDKQYIPYEDIEMKPALWGGIELNKTIPWFISNDELNSNKTVTINIIKFPQPKTLDDISYLSKLPSLSQQFRAKLLPTIS